MFLPAPGEAGFVELKSSGGSVSLTGLYLLNERGESFSLPENVNQLAADQFLLILFDGANPAEGNTIHADAAGFLDPESGFVELYAADGTLLDRAAWGADQPAAVKLSRGGVIVELDPGTTIGRFPLSAQPDPLEWTIFAPVKSTPGAANPQPGVDVMIPLNGAVIRESSFELSWYSVPGATQYRAQVASDEAFSALVVDETVDTPEVAVELQAGTYFWRVQAMAADGLAADFSPAQKLTVESDTSSLHAAAPAAQASLGVPFISQHKDTAMLLLESKNETGAHAWDVDHVSLDRSDPADNTNCALASVAMINAFFGGDLSQDRIGFEILRQIASDWLAEHSSDAVFGSEPLIDDRASVREQMTGPEWDLMYDRGVSYDEITEALAFALEGESVFRPHPETLDVLWADIQLGINAGAPILGAIPGHAIVITGYYEDTSTRYVMINDPYWGAYALDLTAVIWKSYWMTSPGSIPILNDPEISMDSDGDGIVDFDETQRFGTNLNDEDTDKDDLKDKDDLRTSIYDEQRGYSLYYSWSGRDYDNDGIRMELDEDSDGGGCFDGMEDFDLDGKYKEPETYNFDEKDDPCFWGTDEWVREETKVYDDGSSDHQYVRQFAKFSLRAAENGTLEGLAQVTYTHTGVAISDDCGRMTLAGAEELSWQVKLSGTWQKLSEDSVFVSAQAPSDLGRAHSAKWVGGVCEQFSEAMQLTWFMSGIVGTLVDGVYDFSIDSGEFWQKTHMEQGEGQ